jgi:hypothetical protein
MAFPLGAKSKIYDYLVGLHPTQPVTVSEYNSAVQWINAQSGSNIPIFTETALAPPTTPATAGGGAVFTGTGAGGTSEVMNPQERQNQWSMEQQKVIEAGSAERAQIAANTQLAAAQAQAAATLQAQQEADRAALERLRYQLGNDLASALMTNDLNKARETIDVANLAADPRSTVGFLEYLGKQGGGPTALSQGLVAGQTPSPVWDVIPQTQGYSPEVQSLIDQLKGFIGTATK